MNLLIVFAKLEKQIILIGVRKKLWLINLIKDIITYDCYTNYNAAIIDFGIHHQKCENAKILFLFDYSI